MIIILIIKLVIIKTLQNGTRAYKHKCRFFLIRPIFFLTLLKEEMR